jgi:hypothetical protein
MVFNHGNHGNVKTYVRKDPPYAWKDVTEEAKHDAMAQLSYTQNQETEPYWNMGLNVTESKDDCPNWVARWLLYHQFQNVSQTTEERRKFATHDDQPGICDDAWSLLTLKHQREGVFSYNVKFESADVWQHMTSENLP